MSILLTFIFTVITVLILFYLIIGYITAWMADEIFKSTESGKMNSKLRTITFLFWPAVINDTITGFKDTIVLQLGKMKSSDNNMDGLGSLFGSMGNMFNNHMGGPDAAQDNSPIIDADTTE